jgi:hypothetical protein
MQQFFSLLSWRLFTAQKAEKLLHQVGNLFELYDDARTYKP